MDWAPPFYRGPPERRGVPPAAALGPQRPGRDSFYNPAGRSEEEAGAAYPPGFPGPERSRAAGDWRPAAPSYRGGRDRGLPGGPGLVPLGRGQRPWDGPWDPPPHAAWARAARGQPPEQEPPSRQPFPHPCQGHPQPGPSYPPPPLPYPHPHPLRAQSQPEQQPPFPERVAPPPNVQNAAPAAEDSRCQNQPVPQSGGLGLSAGYGAQPSQLMNPSHNNQQNFPNLPPSWKSERGLRYKRDDMATSWPSVANFPQGVKGSSMEQQQRNESVTKFLSPEQFSHDFKNRESTNEQDELWLMRFVSKCKLQASEVKKSKPVPLISEVKESLLSACKLVAELTALCQQLRQNVENEEIWTESYLKAIEVKTILQEKLKTLTDSEYISSVKKKLEAMKKKRRNIQRKKQEWCLEKQEQKARMAEKEAKIDTWRIKCVREVEEKKRERELKAAADSVLSEVRKKQADAKRLVDVLRALEKLRKLRKEAAARKGVHPPPSADENFEHHIERLRKLIKKRSDLYDAEERALRVMLEGEQEEERKRENEKKLKKEREKLEKQQREVESMLFGDPELPADHPLQPFHQYYLQAERSSHVLVQIRQEWDRYLVPGDHPDGSGIPHGWIFPCPPSSDVWGTALKQNES